MIYGIAGKIKGKDKETAVKFSVAAAPDELSTGLRESEEPEEGSGMLLYPPPDQSHLSLWMHGVPFDLDVYFLYGNPTTGWEIQEMRRMTAFDTTAVTPTKKCNAALEVRSGSGAESHVGGTFTINEASEREIVSALHRTSPEAH